MASQNPYISVGALAIVLAFAVIGHFLIKLLAKKNSSKKKEEKSWYDYVTIPPLIGMLVFGCFARNVLPSEIMDHYNDSWASNIRMACLAVVLLRGGLELEFKGKGLFVLLLIFLPSSFESTTVAFISQSIFGLPIALAFALGFVFAAVSPSILVPLVMNLHMEGYGADKGIPVSLIASGSLEDALMITLFGICTTIGWNTSNVSDSSLGMIVGKNIYELAGGIAAGVILGLIMYIFKKTNAKVKCALTFTLAILFTIVCEIIKAKQSKYVGVIAYGYVCFRVWGNEKPKKELAYIWNYMTPFLFGTVGASLQFSIIDGSVIANSIWILFVGVTIRCCIAYLVTGVRKDFSWKEKIFVAAAWLPKATVQAALGGVVLDMARSEENGQNLEKIRIGFVFLTVTVFAIVFTAPLGAILINTLGPKCLNKKEENVVEENGQKKSEDDESNEKKGVENGAVFVEIRQSTAEELELTQKRETCLEI